MVEFVSPVDKIDGGNSLTSCISFLDGFGC